MLLVFAFFAKAQTSHWPETSGYQYSENITAELYLNGESMRFADAGQYYEIGAFVGDVCRGTAMVSEAPPFTGGGYIYYLTVGSNSTSGETVTFRLYNHQTGEEEYVICETTITFVSDGEEGDLFEPFLIEFVDDPTPRYDITVASNIPGAGIVTGGGLYREGTDCTITATANDAYNFVNWAKNGNVVTTNASYSFTVTEAADFVANFSMKTFEISVSAEPQTYGSVTGGGTYNYGTTCTLTATPNVGYIFFNWTLDDEVVSTDATYSFTATDGVEGEYVAHFATKIFTITASVNPAAGGSVSGAGQIQEGQTCTLVATPNIAYNFVNWTKNGQVVSTDPSYSFTVTDNEAYIANFAIKTFAVTATSSNPNFGTVSGGGTFTYGESCTLEAQVIEENLFVNWTRNGVVVSTNPTYTFQVIDNTDGEYVANFAAALIHINATANPVEGGSIIGTGAFPEGQTCTLKAVARPGYKFVNWTLDGMEFSTEQTISFAVTEPADYVANFEQITNHWTYNSQMQYQCTATLELYLDDVQMRFSDEIARYELGAFVGEECRSSVLASAAPELLGGGYIYIMTIYSERQSGETIQFRLYDHQTEEEVYVICNTTLPFVYQADYGDAFEPVVIEMVTDPTPRYFVTTTANPEEGGTVTGAGRYREGDQCTVAATANTGYSFANWTNANGPVASSQVTDLDFSEQGYENAEAITEVTLDDYVSVEFFQGTNNTNAPKYYTAGAAIRCYNGNYFEVSSTSGPITSITLEFGSGDNTNPITTDVGEFDGDTWEGEATSVTFTIGGTSKHRRIQALTVTYEGANPSDIVSTNSQYTFTVTEATDLVANFNVHTYNITVAAEPEAFGIVTGTGTYEFGQTVTLTGTPNTGYIFFNWTKDGEVVSTEATYTFTAVDGVGGEYVGHFATKVFEITATANPVAGGTITGAGQIQEGQTCTLTAQPNTGYNFVNWTKNGEVVSTNPVYAFTVVDDEVYVANFALKTYDITVTATPVAYGAVAGAGTYTYGTTCTLTATPYADYIFANWTKDGEVVSSDAVYSFTVEDGVEGEYVAQFARSLFHITTTANPANGGVLTGAGAYMEGQTCTLTATANPYFIFVNWTMDGAVITTENTFSFEIVESVEGEYVANFYEIEPHWTFFTGMQYSMTLTGALYIEGESMMNDANAFYYEIGAFVGDNCRGSYLASPHPFGGYIYYMTLYSEVQQGETITFRLYNHLTGTEEELSCITPVVFENNGDFGDIFEPYVINFVAIPSYDITVAADPEEGGTVAGAGTYLEGTEITLTATPYEAYNFVNWTNEEGDEVFSTNTAYTFTVSENADYVAHFELKTFEVIATAIPEEGGEIEGDGVYTYGSECTLIATPYEAYNFLYWMDANEGEIVTEETEMTFTVTEEMEYEAYFELKTYEITVAANLIAGGTVEGAGTYTHGSVCTLTATPDEIYSFVNWTQNGVEVSTDAEYTLTVTAGGDYVANFELKTYDVVVTLNPEGAGFVLGAGNYVHGATCTLTAQADAEHAFVNWTENGEVVSTNGSYSFEVTENHEVVANFLEYHWDVNIYQFPDVYGVIAVVNIDNVEQTNDMLELAAFKGDECRGRDKLMYFDDFGRAYLFMVLHGEEGDVFDSYRLYDHSTQEELDLFCLQEIVFVPDEDLGDLDDPYVFNFGHKQINTLATGYNWYSAYVELNDFDALAMMENSLGDKAKQIYSQTSFVKYYPQVNNWFGSLESINNESMYRIVMNEPGTVEMVGVMANPEDHPITIKKGLNHIGFISSTEMTVDEAFASLEKTNNDQLKTQTAFVKYYPQMGGWFCSILDGILLPGQGLQYKSNNNNDVTFTYPSSNSRTADHKVVTAATDNNYWKSDYYAYANNMTVMAVVELDNEEIASDNYELAAFANGECRGSIRLLYVEPIDRYVAFLTISGDESVDLDLRLYNVKTEEELISNDRLVFTIDADLGDFDAPFVVRFNGHDTDELGMTVYPNPVAQGERVNLVLSTFESVRIEIVNSLGVVVSSMASTSPQVQLTAPSTPGVYTIRVITDGKNIKCNKLLVE